MKTFDEIERAHDLMKVVANGDAKLHFDNRNSHSAFTGALQAIEWVLDGDDTAFDYNLKCIREEIQETDFYYEH